MCFPRDATSIIGRLSCALQWVRWRWLELTLFTTGQAQPILTVDKTLPPILNASTCNTLSVSSCWLSKTMIRNNAFLKCYFVSPNRFFPHSVMLSAQSSVYSVFDSDFLHPTSLSHGGIFSVSCFRREREGIEVLNKDGEAMNNIKEWNTIGNFLEHWILIACCTGCSSKLLVSMGKYI